MFKLSLTIIKKISPTIYGDDLLLPTIMAWFFGWFNGLVPSGKRLHNYGKSPFFMGKLTISMAIFHSYVSHNQRVTTIHGPRSAFRSQASSPSDPSPVTPLAPIRAAVAPGVREARPSARAAYLPWARLMWLFIGDLVVSFGDFPLGFPWLIAVNSGS